MGGVLDRSDTMVGAGDWDNDGHPDVLSRDGAGYLYLFPGDGTRLGNRVQLGAGWNGYTIAGIADWDHDGKQDILARNDSNGELFVYPGEGGLGPSAEPPSRIGIGFNGYQFAGVADYDKDGKQDLIAKDWNGELWLYPGENKRAPSTQDRVRLGYGWGPYTVYGVIDRSGDGAPDLIAESEGTLWLYMGSGRRAPYTGEAYRHNIGTGWANTQAVTTPDFNGDGAVDVIARLPYATTRWHVYPGVVGTTYGGAPEPVAAVGFAEGGVYAYRVAAGDDLDWSKYSDWCEFAVDSISPPKPAVMANVYKPTPGCPETGCGSVGVADTFTFTLSSPSPDVVKFQWGFSDPPTMTVPIGSPTIRWAPPSDGIKTLYVKAIDRAGNGSERTSYEFRVAKPSKHTGRWLHGTDPTHDASGDGHDLTLTGVQLDQRGRLVDGDPSVGFDGSTGGVAKTAKILDTSQSFTVSAWVRLTGDNISRTVVSQQGAATSAFRLGYDAAQRK